MSHCCNTNSISASASVAPAALLENHHYRRGVFQFFFRNQTISTLSRTENRPHSESSCRIVIVGDKLRCHGSVKWIVISGKEHLIICYVTLHTYVDDKIDQTPSCQLILQITNTRTFSYVPCYFRKYGAS